MPQRSHAVNSAGKINRFLKFLNSLGNPSLLFIGKAKQFMRRREVRVCFQLPVEQVDLTIILAGKVKVLGQATANSEREERFKFLLFSFGFGHAVASQQVRPVPGMHPGGDARAPSDCPLLCSCLKLNHYRPAFVIASPGTKPA